MRVQLLTCREYPRRDRHAPPLDCQPALRTPALCPARCRLRGSRHEPSAGGRALQPPRSAGLLRQAGDSPRRSQPPRGRRVLPLRARRSLLARIVTTVKPPVHDRQLRLRPLPRAPAKPAVGPASAANPARKILPEQFTAARPPLRQGHPHSRQPHRGPARRPHPGSLNRCFPRCLHQTPRCLSPAGPGCGARNEARGVRPHYQRHIYLRKDASAKPGRVEFDPRRRSQLG